MEGDTLPFTFSSVPATSSCLEAISLSLDSSYGLAGRPIKFAQGSTDGSGATVDISLPLPPTDAPVVAPTEPPVVAPTEPPVVAPTEPPVPAPTEPPVPAPTEPPVLAPTEPPVPAPTEPPVDPPTGKPGVCSPSAANPGEACASDEECNCSRRHLLSSATVDESSILRGRKDTPDATRMDSRRLKGKKSPMPPPPSPTPPPPAPCACVIPSTCLEANKATCTSTSDCCSGLTCEGDGVCHGLSSCSAVGDPCTFSDQCCSNSCKGKTGRKTCK